MGLNIPPVIFAGQALANGGGGCNVALQWLLINAFFCIVNMAAAVYISGKVVHDPNDDVDGGDTDAPYIEATMESNKTEQQQQQSSSSGIKKFWQGPFTTADETRVVKSMTKVGRVRDVLCYDPMVAVYIIIGIFYIIWQ